MTTPLIENLISRFECSRFDVRDMAIYSCKFYHSHELQQQNCCAWILRPGSNVDSKKESSVWFPSPRSLTITDNETCSAFQHLSSLFEHRTTVLTNNKIKKIFISCEVLRNFSWILFVVFYDRVT